MKHTAKKESWKDRFDRLFTATVRFTKWTDGVQAEQMPYKEYLWNDEAKHDPKLIKSFIESELASVREETIREAIKVVDQDERHAPRCPNDITIPQQGGWYLGRIDGLQSVEEKLEKLLSPTPVGQNSREGEKE